MMVGAKEKGEVEKMSLLDKLGLKASAKALALKAKQGAERVNKSIQNRFPNEIIEIQKKRAQVEARKARQKAEETPTEYDLVRGVRYDNTTKKIYILGNEDGVKTGCVTTPIYKKLRALGVTDEQLENIDVTIPEEILNDAIKEQRAPPTIEGSVKDLWADYNGKTNESFGDSDGYVVLVTGNDFSYTGQLRVAYKKSGAKYQLAEVESTNSTSLRDVIDKIELKQGKKIKAIVLAGGEAICENQAYIMFRPEERMRDTKVILIDGEPAREFRDEVREHAPHIKIDSYEAREMKGLWNSLKD